MKLCKSETPSLKADFCPINDAIISAQQLPFLQALIIPKINGKKCILYLIESLIGTNSNLYLSQSQCVYIAKGNGDNPVFSKRLRYHKRSNSKFFTGYN